MIAETDRLILRKVTTHDAPFFIELMNSPSWLKYIGDRHVKTIDSAKAHLKKTILKSYAESGFGFYIVELKEELNKVIGICGMVKREELEDADIGFGFLPQYEGRGFGYESSLEVLKLAKQKFNLDKITAITLANNKSSIGLLEKLGLKFEKTVKPFDDDEELLLFAKNL